MACYFNDEKIMPIGDFSQTESFVSRRTANGEKILSPCFALVEKIKGKTVKSTNLIPFPYLPKNDASNGIYYTSDDKGVITANGTLTSTNSSYIFARYVPIEIGKVYTLSSAATNNVYYMIQIYNNRGSWVHNIPNTEHDAVTFSVKYNGTQWEVEYSRGNGSPAYFYFDGAADSFTSGSYYFRIFVNLKGSVGDVVNNVKLYPMLNEGTTALPYTPYFAGLKNATISGIKSVGVNLFDINNPIIGAVRESDKAQYSPKIENGVIYNGGIYGQARGCEICIPVEKNADYTFSFDAKVDNSFTERYAQLIGINGLGADNVYTSSSTVSKIINVKDGVNTLTVNSGDWEYIGIAVWAKTKYSIAITNLQIERGSSATDYQPYTESTYQLPESYELGEWDSINPIEKTITRGTRTIVFNGTETFTDAISRFGEVTYSITGSNKMNTAFNDCISNFSNKVIRGNTTGSAIAFQVDKTSTIEEFKEFLSNRYESGDPITVSYPLATATTETVEDLPIGYMAHKDGTETYLAGETDNSEWGAIPEFTLNYPKIMKEGTFNG